MFRASLTAGNRCTVFQSFSQIIEGTTKAYDDLLSFPGESQSVRQAIENPDGKFCFYAAYALGEGGLREIDCQCGCTQAVFLRSNNQRTYMT